LYTFLDSSDKNSDFYSTGSEYFVILIKKLQKERGYKTRTS
jgi:hypothetical protein